MTAVNPAVDAVPAINPSVPAAAYQLVIGDDIIGNSITETDSMAQIFWSLGDRANTQTTLIYNYDVGRWENIGMLSKMTLTP